MKKSIIMFISVIFVIISSLTIFAACGKKETPIELPQITLYEIDAEVSPENHLLTATERVTYPNNTENTLSELKFNLYPNAFRKNAKYKPYGELEKKQAFPSGINYGNIEISSVADTSGNALAYKIDGIDSNILTVKISEIFPGDKVTVCISFIVKLTNSTLRLGYTENSINLANFYPVMCVYNGGYYEQPYHSNGDPFYSDVADYNVNITYPKNYKIATTGTGISETIANDDKKKLSTEAKNVRDYAIVLSDRFSVVTDDWQGVKINYYYFDDANFIQSLLTAKQSLMTYSELFGKYPYAEYDVCQVDFLAGGMEYPSLVYIGKTQDYGFYKEVIAHETAHQWWYGVVGNNEIDYAWLDEGLAEFSTALYYKHNGEPEAYKTKINDAYSSYTLFVELSGKIEKPNTTMSRPSYAYATDTEYYYMTYVKGLIMFNTIYELLGEEQFISAMKDYYEKNYLKNATPSDLAVSLNKASNFNCNSLLNRWIEGKVLIFAFGINLK